MGSMRQVRKMVGDFVSTYADPDDIDGGAANCALTSVLVTGLLRYTHAHRKDLVEFVL